MKVWMAEDIESARERLTHRIREIEDPEVRFVGRDVMPLSQTAGAWHPGMAIPGTAVLGRVSALPRPPGEFRPEAVFPNRRSVLRPKAFLMATDSQDQSSQASHKPAADRRQRHSLA